MRRLGVLAILLFASAVVLLVAAVPPSNYLARLVDKAIRPNVQQVNTRFEASVDTSASGNQWKFVNAPTYLALATYAEEDEQCLHPSVVYVPQGFGGHNWWMVMTPYPTTTPEHYENPSIFYSDDGDSPIGTWTAITSGNPIDPDPDGAPAGDLNVDPTLYFHPKGDGTGTLYCYWNHSLAPGTGEYIKCRTSADGEVWSDELTVITSLATEGTMLSPTVRNIRGTYWMWLVDASGTDKLTYRTSSSPVSGFSAAADCTLNGLESGAVPWHGAVQQVGDKLMLTLTATPRDIYVGESLDGITFDCQKVYDVAAEASAWDSNASYQVSAVWYPREGFADLYYGGWDGTDFFIGKGRLFRLPNAHYDTAPLAKALDILGDVRGFWPFIEANGDGGEEASEIQDWSRHGHDLIPSEDVGAWDTPPVLWSPIHYYAFNATDEELHHPDDANFTFVSGGNDVAMSVGCWVRVTDASAGANLIAKVDAGDAAREWKLIVETNEKVTFYNYDESTDGYEGTQTDLAIPEDIWVFIVAVADATQGNARGAAMVIYVNGLAVAVTEQDDVGDAYVDMEDLGSQLTLGSQDGGGVWYGDAMAMPFVTAKELSADEVWTLYQLTKPMMRQ